jgi:hypothetical protein
MNLQIIKGSFETSDTIELLIQLVNVKIKYHEDKIDGTRNEEDIKQRENRIKQLQSELAHIKNYLAQNSNKISLNCNVEINN